MSPCSARTICREWQIRIKKTKCVRLFEEIAVEADMKVTQAVANGNVANLGSSVLFAPTTTMPDRPV